MITKTHIRLILQATFVTFLWSTSFIIIKWGLAEIPPLTYAALRYSIAFIFFLPFILNKKYLGEIKQLDRSDWFGIFLLGIFFYSFTQGFQFVGLSLLPSVTVSLMLNFTPLVVAILGIIMLKEIPTKMQWLGSFVFMIGILVYFYPVILVENELLGLLIMGFGVLANAISAILGRKINRTHKISPIVLTFLSMGVGAFILLITALKLDGLPSISDTSWIYLFWLAAINTTLAFTIWNYTLRTLSAMESSIINSTMLIQIGILAWIFLGEDLNLQQIIGMLLALTGIVFVQVKFKKNNS